MSELRRIPFRIPEGVDRVLSVRPRWLGAQDVLQADYMVVRIWHDGRGYADDEWSEDDPWYTGQGGQDEPRGRQVRDQELVDGNLGLERSYRAGLPVRVIRRVSTGTDYEYVYEGLYHVVDTHYGPSRDGPKVHRFRLRRLSG